MKIKVILILLLIGMYSAGVGIGSYRQTKAENQDEMYEYLSGAVSEYESKSLESIKSVAKDNAKILVPVLFFGFFKITSLITCTLSIILYILSAVMWLFTSIQNNIEEHGHAFVLFAQRKNKGIDSFIFDLLTMLFFFGVAYAHIIITIGLWK